MKYRVTSFLAVIAHVLEQSLELIDRVHLGIQLVIENTRHYARVEVVDRP